MAKLLAADQCNSLRTVADAVAGDLADAADRDQLKAFDAGLKC